MSASHLTGNQKLLAVSVCVVVLGLIVAGAFLASNPSQKDAGNTDNPLNPVTPIGENTGNGASSITSVLSVTDVTLGGSVTDSVTVHGTDASSPAPTGRITFQVQAGPGAWNTYDTETLTASGSGAEAVSSPYTPLAVASYNFRAVYSGDSNYVGVQSSDVDEPLTMHPVQVTAPVSTVLSKSAVNLGDVVNDSVTVPGLGTAFPAPTGTVEFQVHIGSGQWTTYDNETLASTGVNGVATSAGYRPVTVDSYNFRAVYLGDANYLPAQSVDDAEPLTITLGQYVAPTVATLSHTTITIGTAVTDSVAVRGVGANYPVPSGAVQFQVKASSGSWTTFDTEVLMANGSNGVATSIDYFPSSVGSYNFRALYSGDVNYLASQSGDGAQPLAVHPELYPDTVTASISRNAIIFGHNITNSVTVLGKGAGYPVPTGTVQFQAKADSGPWTTYASKTLSARGTSGVASAIFAPSNVGSYVLRALYLGDVNYVTGQSNGSAALSVSKTISWTVGNVGLSTTVFGRSVTVNETVIGVNGSTVPTGWLNFQWRYTNSGTWTVFDANVPLVNGNATSTWFTPAFAGGDYRFQAIYSGDKNYNASWSCPYLEPLNVVVGPSLSHVNLGTAAINVGHAVTENVTVTGLNGFTAPTGDVTFRVKYETGNWTNYSENVHLVNGHALSTWFAPEAAGSYAIEAVYTGDPNYGSSWAFSYLTVRG
jgi:hypothetical protein